jgi:hypothetical protein
MNYDFLLLVRDKKYDEALLLGEKSYLFDILVLKLSPDNPSVKKFCDFIHSNSKKRTRSM